MVQSQNDSIVVWPIDVENMGQTQIYVIKLFYDISTHFSPLFFYYFVFSVTETTQKCWIKSQKQFIVLIAMF